MRKVKKIFCVVMVFFMTVLNGCRAEAGAGSGVAKVAGKIAVGVTAGVFRAIGKAGAHVVTSVAKGIAKGVARGVIRAAMVVKNEVEDKIADEVSAAIVPDPKSVDKIIDDVTKNAGRAVGAVKENNLVEDVGRAAAFMKEKISDKVFDKPDKKSDDKLIRVNDSAAKNSADESRLNLSRLKVMEKL